MRHAIGLVGALLFAVTGCQGAARTADDSHRAYRSGTRLRAYVYDGGDGASVLSTWFDSELVLYCRFRRTTDGTYRCVPPFGSFAFADDACTDAVLAWGTPALGTIPPGRFVAAPTRVDDPVPAAYEVDFTDVRTAAMLYTHRPDGSCVPLTGDGVFSYARFTSVEMSVFVGAEDRTIGAGRVVGHELVGEDGSWQALRLEYAVRSWDCGTWTEGDLRCVPDYVALRYGMDFGDSACLVPVAQGSGSWNPRAVRAVDEPFPGRIYEIGTETAGFTQVGAMCLPAGRPGFWEIGPEIPDAELAAVVSVDGDTSGRLTVRYLSSDPDGLAVRREIAPFFDHSRGTPCRPWWTSSGVICIDAGMQMIYVQFFGDAACSAPLVYIEPTAGSSEPTIPSVVVTVGETPERFFDVGEAFGGTVYFRGTDGTCAASPTAVPSRFRQLAEIDGSTFAPVEERME